MRWCGIAETVRRFPIAVLLAAASALIALPGNATPQPAAASTTPVAIGGRLVQDATTAKLVFELSAPVAVNGFVLADPDRAIIDLPEVNFQVDPSVGRLRQGGHGGLVTAYRFGLFAPGKSRIVLDLAAPARIVRASTERIAHDETSRLVIELAGSDEAAFRKASAAAALSENVHGAIPKTRLEASADAAASGKPVVVLDPGHGGIDAGASGLGVQEKDIVLAFAQQLADKLTASGRYTVVLTRTSDLFVSLDDRVEIARNAHAALFVSIHADTISSSAQVAGATVYTVSERASDSEAARYAEQENKADVAGGVVASKADAAEVADILFDLTRRETRAYAHVFSRTLIAYLKDVTKLNNNPARSAGFVVLKAPEIPSVLIELGYLSSQSDVKQLQSPDWRAKTAASVAGAIDHFFATRQEGETAPAHAVSPPPSGQNAPDGATVAESSGSAPH